MTRLAVLSMPNQAIQRTSYPVPVLMVTEDFDINLQVKLTVVRRR